MLAGSPPPLKRRGAVIIKDDGNGRTCICEILKSVHLHALFR